ncbi:hypothetical protein A3Q56_07477 [Intoshia linei]|uniref:HAT C-terminal dimerisation domain-containing protein n=1 Tax=Intoshia linei TaxID=1819745 RepID=A0A177AS32_9BILA|nr:hypothetical protein A3Q56_07477 [Intoshia linei]
MDQRNFPMFSVFNSYLNDMSIVFTTESALDKAIKKHLLSLKNEIIHYFPTLNDTDVYNSLIKDLFIFDFEQLPVKELVFQEEFITLINYDSAKITFPKSTINEFWIAMAQSYPNLSIMILKILMPFPTTYEYKKTFSTLVQIKTKSNNRLYVSDDLRCDLFKTVICNDSSLLKNCLNVLFNEYFI